MLAVLHDGRLFSTLVGLFGPRGSASHAAALDGGLPGEADSAWATVDYKWLRAVPRGKFTGVHTDLVYFGDKVSLVAFCDGRREGC